MRMNSSSAGCTSKTGTGRALDAADAEIAGVEHAATALRPLITAHQVGRLAVPTPHDEPGDDGDQSDGAQGGETEHEQQHEHGAPELVRHAQMGGHDVARFLHSERLLRSSNERCSAYAFASDAILAISLFVWSLTEKKSGWLLLIVQLVRYFLWMREWFSMKPIISRVGVGNYDFAINISMQQS